MTKRLEHFPYDHNAQVARASSDMLAHFLVLSHDSERAHVLWLFCIKRCPPQIIQLNWSQRSFTKICLKHTWWFCAVVKVAQWIWSRTFELKTVVIFVIWCKSNELMALQHSLVKNCFGFWTWIWIAKNMILARGKNLEKMVDISWSNFRLFFKI